MFDLTRRDPDGARESVKARPDRDRLLIDLAFDRAFTLAEVSEKLGISLRQVQAHIDDGNLVAVNVGRGRDRRDLRILDEDLEGFARRRRIGVRPDDFVPPAAAANRKPAPVPDTYAGRRAARLAAKRGVSPR